LVPAPSFFSSLAELLSSEAGLLTTEILMVLEFITNLASPEAPEPPTFSVHYQILNINVSTIEIQED